MEKTILIISTMDTKGEETLYLMEQIENLRLKTLLMDISMRGEAHPRADISPERVASAAGSTPEQIRNSGNRSRVTSIITTGATKVARDLWTGRKIHGVIGLGGSTGSLMATDVMRALPFGVPKLMVSSTAALPGLSTRYIGTGDIAIFHSVIEISGVTDLLKNVMDRAAHAMAGMVEGEISSPRSKRGRTIAMTMLGPCEKCASAVRTALEGEGFQVIGFSAAGIGDRAMEDMISQGFFQGVIDLAPGGVGEHLYGFMRDAGPHRLESAGRVGVPQIISTCSVNHMTPAKSKYKPEFHGRRKYDLDRFRTWLRLSPEELRKVAGAFATKLNEAKGPAAMVIPLKGWSSVDAPGNPTYDPEEDLIFIEELRNRLRPEINIQEVDANMEDPHFANTLVKAALKIL